MDYPNILQQFQSLVEREVLPQRAPLRTGWAGLDQLLGGGLVRGGVIEVAGKNSVGKTTFALSSVVEAQQEGLVAFIDAEHALDIGYAADLGVDLDKLLIHSPRCGEEGLETAIHLTNSGYLDLIAIDSVVGLVSNAELEGNMSEERLGIHSRMLAQALKELMVASARTGTTILFTNQTRQRSGKEVPVAAGVFSTWASQRMVFEKIRLMKDKAGLVARVSILRNTLSIPGVSCEIEIEYK